MSTEYPNPWDHPRGIPNATSESTKPQAPWGAEEPWVGQYGSRPQSGAPQPMAPPPPYASTQHLPPYNVLSIIAFVTAFVLPGIVPVVLGHLARGHIRHSGERGASLALAALILGYLTIAFTVLGVIGLVMYTSAIY